MPGFIISGRDNNNGTSQRSDKEYYTSYSWYVPILLSKSYSGSEYEKIISLKDATLPTYTVNKKSATTQVEYKFADSVSFEDVSLTWYDTEGFFVELKSWRDMVWKPDYIGIRQASEYKRDTMISVFRSGGKMVNHTLYNSWPSGIKHSDLTYTSSDIKLVTVTLTYDWADMDEVDAE